MLNGNDDNDEHYYSYGSYDDYYSYDNYHFVYNSSSSFTCLIFNTFF